MLQDEQGTLHPRRRPDYPQDETTAASTPANRRGGLSFHSPKVPTPGNKDVSAPIAQRAAREASPQVGSQQGTESPAVANVVSRETLAIRAKAQETAAKVASPGRTSTAALQHADGRLVVYMYQVTKQGKRRKNGGLDVEIVLDSSSPATRVCVLGRADEGETPGVVTECEGKQRVSFACDNMSRWHVSFHPWSHCRVSRPSLAQYPNTLSCVVVAGGNLPYPHRRRRLGGACS